MPDPNTQPAPERADIPCRKLFAALNAHLEHAEKRYIEEQQDGNAISIASTRATFLGWRDARDLVKYHLSANAEAHLIEGRSPED